MAALSFSAPARVLRVRDQWIGWSAAQRHAHLDRVVNNSRFLILPWVPVQNLASQVLARTLARLPAGLGRAVRDAPVARGDLRRSRPLPRHLLPGGQLAAPSANVREQQTGEGVRLPWRRQGGLRLCPRPALPAPPRVPPTSLRPLSPSSTLARESGGPPDDPTARRLVARPRPGVTLTEAEIARRLADALVAFHAQFHACFGRIEHRRLGLAYLSGLLSNAAAKSVEPIALAFLDADAVRPLQRFLKAYRWDDAAMAATHQALLAETLAAPDGMLTVDSCEFPKKGTESVGVARQYCGALRESRELPVRRLRRLHQRAGLRAWWPAGCTCRASGLPRRRRSAGRTPGSPRT